MVEVKENEWSDKVEWKSDAVREEIMKSSPIDWRKTTEWRLGNDSNTILGEMYEKQGEFLDEWAKHERLPYLRGKVVDFLGRDFLFWS